MPADCSAYFHENPVDSYSFIGFYKYRRQEEDFMFSFRKESFRLKRDLERLTKDDSDKIRVAASKLLENFKASIFFGRGHPCCGEGSKWIYPARRVLLFALTLWHPSCVSYITSQVPNFSCAHNYGGHSSRCPSYGLRVRCVFVVVSPNQCHFFARIAPSASYLPLLFANNYLRIIAMIMKMFGCSGMTLNRLSWIQI